MLGCKWRSKVRVMQRLGYVIPRQAFLARAKLADKHLMKNTWFIVMLVLGLVGVTSGQSVTLTVIPSYGPPQYAASFPGYAAGAVATIKATGTLPTGSRTGPTDARLATRLVAEGLMTTTNKFFYGANGFSPVAPWEKELGATLWWWTIAEADTGLGETVSLTDISAALKSIDTDNVLGKVVSFNGTSYSLTALGIRADRSEIVSGSANQPAQKVIVGIASKSFPMEIYSIGEIQNFVSQPGWRTEAKVFAKGLTVTASLAVTQPALNPMKIGNKLVIGAVDNGDPSTYPIESATSLAGPWTPAGAIRAGQAVDLGSVASRTALFVRYTK